MRRALKRPTDRHAPATFVREFPAILLFRPRLTRCSIITRDVPKTCTAISPGARVVRSAMPQHRNHSVEMRLDFATPRAAHWQQKLDGTAHPQKRLRPLSVSSLARPALVV